VKIYQTLSRSGRAPPLQPTHVLSLHSELNETVQEKEDLKKQMQEYVMEVKRCQELLTSKVDDIPQLLSYTLYHIVPFAVLF
jgi:hypothetical protein